MPHTLSSSTTAGPALSFAGTWLVYGVPSFEEQPRKISKIFHIKSEMQSRRENFGSEALLYSDLLLLGVPPSIAQRERGVELGQDMFRKTNVGCMEFVLHFLYCRLERPDRVKKVSRVQSIGAPAMTTQATSLLTNLLNLGFKGDMALQGCPTAESLSEGRSNQPAHLSYMQTLACELMTCCNSCQCMIKHRKTLLQVVREFLLDLAQQKLIPRRLANAAQSLFKNAAGSRQVNCVPLENGSCRLACFAVTSK